MNQIHGVDISHWQGLVNFEKLKSSGVSFVYAKATDGANGLDKMFARNRDEAHGNDLLFGSYHFFQPADDINKQVDNYIKAIGAHHASELPPVIDWESLNSGGLSKGTQVLRVLHFLQSIEKICLRTPMIYGSPGFLSSFGDLSLFSGYPLWIAHYGVNHPRIPRPWHNYLFWQYSESGGMDKDYFNGSLDDLKRLSQGVSL